MDKTVYSGTALLCVVLIIGSGWFPDNAAMWLASTSPLMNIARGVLSVLMLGLVVTDPPRLRAFRAVLGLAAVGFLTASISRLFSGSVQLVDALIFAEAAIAFGLAALEARPVELPTVLPVHQEAPYIQQKYSFNRQAYGAVPDGAKVALPQGSTSDVLSKLAITIGVLSGALYTSRRPYRALWRGT